MVAGETPATEVSAVDVSPTANSTTLNCQLQIAAVRGTSCLSKFSPLGRRASYLHRRSVFLRGERSAIVHISAIPLFSFCTNPTENEGGLCRYWGQADERQAPYYSKSSDIQQDTAFAA